MVGLYIDWDSVCLATIFIGFLMVFLLLFLWEYIYDFYLRHLEWGLPILGLLFFFGVILLMVYETPWKIVIVITCILGIIYLFKVMYKNKYLKGFKSLKKKELKSEGGIVFSTFDGDK
jgi:hypothetical protein